MTHILSLMGYEGIIMPTLHTPSLAVRRALSKLGGDIYDARKRRKLSAKVVSERAFTSRKTLKRVEDGDYRVSIGIYASVLQALGMIDGLADLADASRDKVGLQLMSDAARRKSSKSR